MKECQSGNCTWKLLWEIHCVFLFYAAALTGGLKWIPLFSDVRRQSKQLTDTVYSRLCHVCSGRSICAEVKRGQRDSTPKWGVSRASHSHSCDANACHISRCAGQKFWVILGPPPLSHWRGPTNDHLQVWHCLWQMYFLMKVWGQRVPSRGWRSINNYSLQSFWQFFQHPSSTPTAPFLSIHIVCLLDYRRRAKTFYRLSGVFLLVVLAKVSISITTAHSVLKIRDLSKP